MSVVAAHHIQADSTDRIQFAYLAPAAYVRTYRPQASPEAGEKTSLKSVFVCASAEWHSLTIAF